MNTNHYNSTKNKDHRIKEFPKATENRQIKKMEQIMLKIVNSGIKQCLKTENLTQKEIGEFLTMYESMKGFKKSKKSSKKGQHYRGRTWSRVKELSPKIEISDEQLTYTTSSDSGEKLGILDAE